MDHIKITRLSMEWISTSTVGTITACHSKVDMLTTATASRMVTVQPLSATLRKPSTIILRAAGIKTTSEFSEMIDSREIYECFVF